MLLLSGRFQFAHSGQIVLSHQREFSCGASVAQTDEWKTGMQCSGCAKPMPIPEFRLLVKFVKPVIKSNSQNRFLVPDALMQLGTEEQETSLLNAITLR